MKKENKLEDELLKELREFTKKYGYKATLESFEDQIISLNNPKLSVFFAFEANPNKEKHDKIILESGDLDSVFEYIKLNVKNLESLDNYSDFIYESKDGEYNLKLVRLFFDECFHHWENEIYYILTSSNSLIGIYTQKIIGYLNKHIKGVINSGNVKSCLRLRDFLKDANSRTTFGSGYFSSRCLSPIELGKKILKETNIFDLEGMIDDVIIGSGDAKYIFDNIKYNLNPWYRESTKPSLSRYSEAIALTKDAYYNYLFVKEYAFSKDYIKKHGDIVIEDGEPRINYHFASEIPGADIVSHSKAIIKSKNPNFNYLFAKFVISKKEELKRSKKVRHEFDLDLEERLAMVDIKEHERAVIESKDPDANYQFSKIKGADIEAHRKVVLDSKDVTFNYEFILLNDKLPDDKKFDDYLHRLIVLESGNVEYNYKLALNYPNHQLYDKHVLVVINSEDEEYLNKLPNLKTVMENRINDKIKKLSL